MTTVTGIIVISSVIIVFAGLLKWAYVSSARSKEREFQANQVSYSLAESHRKRRDDMVWNSYRSIKKEKEAKEKKLSTLRCKIWEVKEERRKYSSVLNRLAVDEYANIACYGAELYDKDVTKYTGLLNEANARLLSLGVDERRML